MQKVKARPKAKCTSRQSCLIITQDLIGLLNYFHTWSLKETEVHLINDQIRNDLLICQCNLLMKPHLHHVLQLMLMQLRWTSTQVDYTHQNLWERSTVWALYLFPQNCFWKDDLQIGSYINARRRDQPSKRISPPFLNKHFYAKKTHLFWKRNSFGSIMTKFIPPNLVNILIIIDPENII